MDCVGCLQAGLKPCRRSGSCGRRGASAGISRGSCATARDFLSFCYTRDLAIEVTLQPIRRFGFDASIIFSDILVIPDALGQRVRFVEGEGPRLDAIETPEALQALATTLDEEKLQPVYEALRGVRAACLHPPR